MVFARCISAAFLAAVVATALACGQAARTPEPLAPPPAPSLAETAASEESSLDAAAGADEEPTSERLHVTVGSDEGTIDPSHIRRPRFRGTD